MLNYESQLPSYSDYEFLYNNLMIKPNNKKNIVTESDKRENIITQLLIDKYNLSLNPDYKFENRRKLFFYVISICNINDKNTILQTIHILKTNSNQNVKFKVDNINYIASLQIKNSTIKRVDSSEGETKEVFLDSYKTKSNDYDSNINNVDEKDDNTFYFRKFLDKINNETFLFTVKYTNHEVDGNVITKEDIDLKNGLIDILYYPKIEKDSSKKEGSSTGVEEENEDLKKEDNNNNGEPLELESIKEEKELTKIKKGTKILIEIKQNTSLLIMLDQMKKLMKDFQILLQNDEYCYFGFVNETKAKEGLNEVEFLEKIKEYEKTYNFRIFLFILKNNTLFDLQLEDQVDYSVHFRNESKKEIDAIKQEIGEMKKDIADVKTRIDNLDKKFDEFSDMIKRALGIKNEEKNLEKK